jgi:microcystin-dependent protein
MATIFPLSASVGQQFQDYAFDGESWNILGENWKPFIYSATEPDFHEAGFIWVDSNEVVDEIYVLPTQTGNDGKYLTTSGSVMSWSTIDLQATINTASAAAVTHIVDSAPGALDTLNELAAALGDDSNYASTITNALSNKLNISTASSTYLTQSDAATVTPVGSIVSYAMNTPPVGWLLCDGSIYSASAYPTLSVGLGSTYGGNGTTTFAVPNLKGRVVVGIDASQTEFDTRGETGGAKTHTLTSAEMPSHTHTQDSHNHSQNAHGHSIDPPTVFSQYSANWGARYGAPEVPYRQDYGTSIGNSTATNIAATATNQNTGGGGAHNNLQPYMALNYIIRAV